jgi:hypothetical protein
MTLPKSEALDVAMFSTNDVSMIGLVDGTNIVHSVIAG